MERKVGSGRKGTVDEEEYLLKSVTKLVDRFLMTEGQFHLGSKKKHIDFPVSLKLKQEVSYLIYFSSLWSTGRRD